MQLSGSLADCSINEGHRAEKMPLSRFWFLQWEWLEDHNSAIIPGKTNLQEFLSLTGANKLVRIEGRVTAEKNSNLERKCCPES